MTAGQPATWIQHLETRAKTLIAEKRAEWKAGSVLAVSKEPQAVPEDVGLTPSEQDALFRAWSDPAALDDWLSYDYRDESGKESVRGGLTDEKLAALASIPVDDIPEVQAPVAPGALTRPFTESDEFADLATDLAKGALAEGISWGPEQVASFAALVRPQHKGAVAPAAPAQAPSPSASRSPLASLGHSVLWLAGLIFYPFIFLWNKLGEFGSWLGSLFEARPVVRRQRTPRRLLGLEALEARYELSATITSSMLGSAFPNLMDSAQTAEVQVQDTELWRSTRGDVNETSNAGAGTPLMQAAPFAEMPTGFQMADGLITENVEFPSLQFEAGGAAQPETVIGVNLPVFQGEIVPGSGLERLQQTLSQGDDQVGSFAIVALTHVYDADGDGQPEIFLGRSKFDDFDNRVQQAYNFLNTTSTQYQAYSSLITGIGLDGTPLGEVRQAMMTQGFHTIDFSFFHLGRLYDATGDGEVDVNFNADAVTSVTLGDKNFEFQTPAHVTEGLLYLQRPEAAPIGDLLSGHLQRSEEHTSEL